jgi:hypothetical protein
MVLWTFDLVCAETRQADCDWLDEQAVQVMDIEDRDRGSHGAEGGVRVCIWKTHDKVPSLRSLGIVDPFTVSRNEDDFDLFTILTFVFQLCCGSTVYSYLTHTLL